MRCEERWAGRLQRRSRHARHHGQTRGPTLTPGPGGPMCWPWRRPSSCERWWQMTLAGQRARRRAEAAAIATALTRQPSGGDTAGQTLETARSKQGDAGTVNWGGLQQLGGGCRRGYMVRELIWRLTGLTRRYHGSRAHASPGRPGPIPVRRVAARAEPQRRARAALTTISRPRHCDAIPPN